jgi:hypothetical protein
MNATPIVGTLGAIAIGQLACVSDNNSDMEYALVTGVDTVHNTISMTLNRPRAAGTIIGVGGSCGYVLVLDSDTTYSTGGANAATNGTLPTGALAGSVDTIRTGWQLIGSPDQTHAAYWFAIDGAGGYYAIGGPTTSLLRYSTGSTFVNSTGTLTSVSYNSGTNTVTATISGSFGYFARQQTPSITVSGVTADPAYNGTFAVSYPIGASNQFTYTPLTAPSVSSGTGGSIAQCNCTFHLYPAAQVVQAFNPATNKLDGTLTLSPNAATWTQGDYVEELHWPVQSITNHNTIASFGQQNNSGGGMGFTYNNRVTGAQIGFAINNNNFAGYRRQGGLLDYPRGAYRVGGMWYNSFVVDYAPEQSLFNIPCKFQTSTTLACTSAYETYNLFTWGSNGHSGYSVVYRDSISVDPLNDNISFAVGGQTMSLGATSGYSGAAGAYVSGGLYSSCTLRVAGISTFVSKITLSDGSGLTGSSGGASAKPLVTTTNGLAGASGNLVSQDGSGNVQDAQIASSKLTRNCGTLTSTASTSDSLSCTWVTTSSGCQVSPTNATGVTLLTGATYAVTLSAGSVKITHAATSGGTFSIACSAS